MAKIIR